MTSQASLADLDVNEQLFHAMSDSSVEESGGLLGRVTDVDIRNTSGRTPLHMAVRIGKLDWTERLLRLGADPLIEDKGDLTVLQSAEEMCTKYPDDPDRKEILKLVSLVHSRESLKVEKNCEKCASPKQSDAGVLTSLLSKLWKEMTLSWESVSEQLNKISSKMELPIGASRPGDMVLLASLLSRLSQDMLSFRQSVIAQLAAISCKTESMPGNNETANHSDIVSLPSLLSRLLQDFYKGTGGPQLSEISSKIDRLSEQMATLSTALPSMKEADRELAKDLLSVSECVKQTNSVAFDIFSETSCAREILVDVKEKLNASGVGSQESVEAAKTGEGRDVKQDWRNKFIMGLVDSMMKRTAIFNVDAYVKASSVSQCYEKLLSLSDETRSIFLFVLFKTKVQVFIDLASYYVGGMKGKFRNLDGIEEHGGEHVSFADFDEGKIFIGGYLLRHSNDITVFINLTSCLAEMSMFYAFRNNGRPYAVGDKANQLQYGKIIEILEKKHETHFCFDRLINGSMSWNTPQAREISLIVSVPAMIATYGLEGAKLRLRIQFPRLLDFYSNNVLPNLLI